MKKFLFVLPLFSLTIQSVNAVKTASLKDDAMALEAGKNAPAVCAQYIFLGEGENMVRVKGSGTLVASDIVATSAHLFSPYSEDQESYEKHIKNFTPGIPVKISGFVTFMPDATQAISNYEADPTSENLSRFYEVDSVIIDPSFPINEKSAAPRYDRAFIKLKRPVKDVDPISLYTQGTIPEEKLKIHNQKLINDKEMSMEELLIDAYAYGYGSDINQKFGQKRGIYQPCFLGVDPSKCEEDDDSYPSDSADDAPNPSIVQDDEHDYSSDREDPSHPSEASNDENSYSCESTSSDVEWADKTEVNEGDSIPLTAYFPGYKENLEITIKINNTINVFDINKKTNKFSNDLSKIIREKEGALGIIDEGDSGGALIIAGKLAGIVAQGNNFGEPLARNVKEFSDMPQLYQIYENYYAPLFNVKTGELLAEIPEMIKTLQAHPISNESHLEDLLLLDKKKRQRQRQEFVSAFTLAIFDLETLLLPNLSLENFESVIHKYSAENKPTVTIGFEEALSHFKNREFGNFEKKIQEKIEKIHTVLKEMSL